jgi:hypothetical protein
MPLFALNAEICVAGAPTSRVVGIDHYQLENYQDQTMVWPSYTLVSEPAIAGTFKRWWITDFGDSGQWAWLDLGQTPLPTGLKILPERSGLATIVFEGDAGPSTPTASLTVFEAMDGTRYGLERFQGSQTLRFKSVPLLRLPFLAL